MNKQNISETKNLLHSFSKIKLSLILQSILTGLFGGIIIVLYRFMLEIVTKYTFPLYEEAKKSPFKIIILLIVLAFLGYIVGLLVKIDPMIKGSGIPQVQGYLIGKFNMNWLKVIVLKFLGGIITLGTGLSLGREGPSVQIGSAAGLGVSKLFKNNKTKERFLVTCGSSGGLAAAFNSPLAGVMFALEEIHKSFSPLLLLSVMASAISADFVSKNFFGMTPVLYFSISNIIPLNNYFYLILLGAVLGCLGVLFNKSILSFMNKYNNLFNVPIEFKPIIPFLFCGIIGLTLPELLGGGHSLILSLMNTKFTLGFLFLLLIVKFLFTIVSYSSSTPGGIFLPLLSIGSITGCILGIIFTNFLGLDPKFTHNLVLLSMAGYFTSVVKSPITGIILISEMTGSFNHLLSLSVVCITSYIISDLLNGEPVYEMLLNNMLNKNEDSDLGNGEKVLLEIPVRLGSSMDNYLIKDLSIPKEALLVSINRKGKEIIPNGTTELIPGDFMVVLTEDYHVPKIMDYFNKKS